MATVYTHHNSPADPLFGTTTTETVADAPAPTVIAVTTFKKRFTFAEKTAIVQSTDAGVRVFWDELNTADAVDLSDPDTIAGVTYLSTLGTPLITSARATAILTP